MGPLDGDDTKNRDFFNLVEWRTWKSIHCKRGVRQDSDYPIVQYADDTLLVMQACRRQLVALKALAYICKFNWTQGQLQQVYHATNQCDT